ncbi:MAG: TonB-dependent receptor plug domain-containing protein [Mediterranea sp.]|jgi:outer membrane cobalamin receptor|nr:TonB-dependent receptor plug domain-containing protein [Mediterranea sp.]
MKTAITKYCSFTLLLLTAVPSVSVCGQQKRVKYVTESSLADTLRDVQLDEVVITAGGVKRVQRTPFNAVAVDTRELQNSTKNLSEALGKLPGMKLRESGGVGSDTQYMLDGFSGRHVKVFIDGVPQEGVGVSFGLNNIPVGFAERIEVYKGVVPVGFGTDALGGVINIVTNKKRRRWFADASYSYGSFNTHKSYVNFGQSFPSGLMYEVNAFQNYSDNSYYVDTPVEHFNTDGSTSLNSKIIEHVKRFNDTYHNEAVIGKVGLLDKSFADRLVLSFTWSNFYKEIQTGVIQKVVFGEKHRKGYSLMPALEYGKRDLFTKGLDVTLTAGYNNNLTQNIDTASYRFNWLGERKYLGGQTGEQSYQNSEFVNHNWNGTFSARYRIGLHHSFTLNHVLQSFVRSSLSDVTSSISDGSIDKVTTKNITGLQYRLLPNEQWNLSVFAKLYAQHNQGPVSTNSNGIGNYERRNHNMTAPGYGVAGTYFIVRPLQVKLSYERAYRLPGIDELFGDEDLEIGKIELKPEQSHNINLSISYDSRLGKHTFYAEGSLVYRDTRDYIRRRTDSYSGNKVYASFENHGRVRTEGFNVSARYGYAGWLAVGGTFNYMDVRDRERYANGGTQQASLTFGARLPNQPYMFANADLSLLWRNFLRRGNQLTFTYDDFYMHSFPLYWENLGDASTKERVPSQFSHNVSLTYSIGKGRYNFSVECKNLTNEKLYDNFSLQKAGRAFYGKVRVYFGG